MQSSHLPPPPLHSHKIHFRAALCSRTPTFNCSCRTRAVIVGQTLAGESGSSQDGDPSGHCTVEASRKERGKKRCGAKARAVVDLAARHEQTPPISVEHLPSLNPLRRALGGPRALMKESKTIGQARAILRRSSRRAVRGLPRHSAADPIRLAPSPDRGDRCSGLDRTQVHVGTEPRVFLVFPCQANASWRGLDQSILQGKWRQFPNLNLHRAQGAWPHGRGEWRTPPR